MLGFYVWFIVQILVESLPVSSSGHCKLLEIFFSKIGSNFQTLYQQGVYTIAQLVTINVYEYWVQGFTVALIALFFFRQWFFMLRHIWVCKKIIAKIIFYTALADLVTMTFFIFIKTWGVTLPLGIGFAITAIALLSLRLQRSASNQKLNWKKALILGCVQGCALMPGVSRFGLTYVCARWMNIAPRRAFEISWLIQIPLISMAFLCSSLIMTLEIPSSLITWPFIIVIACATFASFYILRFSYRCALAHKFWLFGIYMIVPILVWLILTIS